MKTRLSQLFFVLSQPKLSAHFKILFSLMLFKEAILILYFMYCYWRNTPTYQPMNLCVMQKSKQNDDPFLRNCIVNR